jgi:K+/H+ antiporter YhaU regulatory subunit KhtT
LINNKKKGECDKHLDENIIAPIYSQIALDIALRISNGELTESTKIYGRSVMASEYGVSPETIRRALKLLEDMNIVETKQNSGTIVISAENAKIYIERFGEQNDIRLMQKKLNNLLTTQEDLNHQISNIVNSIVRMNDKFTQTNPFQNHEISLPSNSSIVGRTLSDLNFWQETKATVIAIRRGHNIILSPGPYVLFQPDDTIIFIGDSISVHAVNEFIIK